jgi:hypothetical protein
MDGESELNKKTAALLIACGMPVMAMAQPTAAPALKAGDTWTYIDTVETGPTGWHQTHDAITMQRVTDSHLYISSKPVGSGTDGREVIVNADWSRVREISGSEVVVNRPLAFPLEAGKTWNIQYTEPHPNAKLKSATWTTKYKVVGYEDVEVPAGKFHALKIEAEGDWRGELAPLNTVVQAAQTQQGQTTLVTQARQVTPEATAGRTYKAFWYAPEVGRWVKSVEEYYGSDSVRTQRITSELEAYKVSGS